MSKHRGIREKVRPDGTGKFTIDFRAGAYGRRRETVSTYHDKESRKLALKIAQAKLTMREGEVAIGTYRPPGEREERLRLNDLLTKFEKGYEPRRSKSVTDNAHLMARIKVLRRTLGTSYLDKIEDHDIKKFRDARLSTASPSTVRKDLSVLNTVFRWGEAKGLVSGNPASPLLVRRPKEPRRQVVPLSVEAEQYICSHASEWLARAIRFFINTGIDRGNLVALTWDQIDRKRWVIEDTRHKTGVSRRFYYELNEPITTVLAECWKLRRLGTENRVFLGNDGRALTVEGLKTGLRKLYARIARLEKKAKVPEKNRLKLDGGPCRIFRHTFRSRLIDRGVDRDLQRYLMGHGDRTMTDHYGAPSDRRIREALRCPLYWDEGTARPTAAGNCPSANATSTQPAHSRR